MKKSLKSSIILLHFLIGNLFVLSSCGQQTMVNNSDLQLQNTLWKGNLTYLNYSDDKSNVKIPCTLETSFKKGKLFTMIIFDELDKKGKKMKDKSNISISKNGQYLFFGKDKWEIISNKKTKDNLEIIATKRGKDNNRPSDFKITLTIENGNSISWKKDVRYDGTAEFFNRNQFTFSKK